MKNITRYEQPKHKFNGWRVCIARQRARFCRYFADAFYKSEAASKVAAMCCRDGILEELTEGTAPRVVFARWHRKSINI